MMYSALLTIGVLLKRLLEIGVYALFLAGFLNCEGIQQSSDDAKTIQACVKELQSGDSKQRIAAAVRLIKYGAGAQPATQALIENLRHSNADVRATSAFVLGAIGPPATGAVPKLIAMLEDEVVLVRSNSAEALGQIRPNAKVAFVPLSKALKDPEPIVCIKSAIAMNRIDPEAANMTLPVLVHFLTAESIGIRCYAVAGIVEVGKPAMSVLLKALTNEDTQIRDGASGAIGLICLANTIDEETTIQSLIKALRANDPSVRRNVAWALGSIGSKASAARSSLLELLQDRDASVRDSAAEAIRSIESLTKRPDKE